MNILSNIATELFKKYSTNSKKHYEVAKQLLSEWNIPLGLTIDLLTLKKELKYESEYVLYHIIYELDKTALPKNTRWAKKFDYKYNNELIQFPLTFNMIEIEEGQQYIGKISAQKLFQLGNANLINYNENTQRSKRKIKDANGDYYGEIFLNAKMIKNIEKSFSEKKYIPDTITLNIPDIRENDVHYNPQTYSLIIKKLKEFDIIDGYQRFIAIQRKCALDKGFDCTMELRITCFTEDKAKQFIWQEEQRNTIPKLASDSLNVHDVANVIVDKLQDDISYGKYISYNRNIIGAAELSNAISVVYDIKRTGTSEIDLICEEILKGFEKFQKSYDEIFDHQISDKDIFIMISMIRLGTYDYDMLQKISNKVKIITPFYLKDFKRVKSILKGGELNV